ncbi:MAG: protein kinase domain-containing protein, partial [Chroococcales cyanobacterium]
GWSPTELEVRDLAKQLLEILMYLHQLTPPVVHRDIKPQNIIRQSDGKVFLVDFGAVQDTYRHTIASGSTIVGTYGYMAPEQFRGQAKPATDLYGLGATLLFLLTHKDPADFPEKRIKIDFRPYVTITPELADWLEKMLEPVIEDRFTSATEALAELQGKRERIMPRSPGNWQPVGSRIVLEKTSRQLKVKVPPPNEQFADIIGDIMMGVFGVPFFLMFIPITLVITISSLVAGNFFIVFLLFVPFWWIVLGILNELLLRLRSKFVYSNLIFYRDRFEISGFFCGIKRTVRGNIDDICWVEVNQLINKNSNRESLNCALEVGVKSYLFGSGLTETERDRLATEIADFIRKPKIMEPYKENTYGAELYESKMG